LSASLLAAWTAHLCGLCLALREEHGQFARLVTNYDGLVISALVEAQSVRSTRRQAGPCPLRGMRRAEVAQGSGAKLAAAVSLLLASAKLRDHVVDGDGVCARRPVAGAARRVASRWARQGAASGRGVGLDTAVLVDAVRRQSVREAAAGPGTSVLAVTEPTETATAAAFAHTAVLAGHAGNFKPLAEAGRLFGRVAHLLDAVEDLESDAASGAWNPLRVTGTGLDEARRLCDDAALGIKLALADAEFTDQRLVHALLVHEVRHAVTRTFARANPPDPPPDYPGFPPWPPVLPESPPPPPSPRRRQNLAAGCAMWTFLCCTCQCCRDSYPDPFTQEPKTGWCLRDGCCQECCGECCCPCDC
jgi:hypothetical protein